MAIVRAFYAELLKLKRTLAFRLALIMPLAVAGINFLVFLDRGEYMQLEDHSMWVELIQYTLVFWSLLALPLFVTLETALLAGLEHNNRQWKHLYALPIRRPAVYLAKQFAAMILIGISMLALVAGTLASGLVLRLLKPGIGFESAMPWRPMLYRSAVVFLSSWLVIALQNWVGLRWRSFVVASAVGIVLTVAGMVAISTDWGSFYPWAIPGMIANGFHDGELRVAEMWFGCLGGLVAALVGSWEVTRRDVL